MRRNLLNFAPRGGHARPAIVDGVEYPTLGAAAATNPEAFSPDTLVDMVARGAVSEAQVIISLYRRSGGDGDTLATFIQGLQGRPWNREGAWDLWDILDAVRDGYATEAHRTFYGPMLAAGK